MRNPATWLYVVFGWMPAAAYMVATGDTDGWPLGLAIYLLTCGFFIAYSGSKDAAHERFLRSMQQRKEQQ